MTEAAKAKTPKKSTRETLAEIGMVYTDGELEAAGREMEEMRAKTTPTPPHLPGQTPPADL